MYLLCQRFPKQVSCKLVNETSQVNAMLNCGCGTDAKEKRSTHMNPEKGKLKPVNTFNSIHYIQ